MLSCMQIELYAEPDPAPDLQPQVAPASRPGVLLRADRPLTGQPFPEHGRRDEAEGLAAARPSALSCRHLPVPCPEPAHHHKEEGREKESQGRGHDHACQHGCAQGILSPGSRARTEHKKDNAQDKAERGHENGPQALPCGRTVAEGTFMPLLWNGHRERAPDCRQAAPERRGLSRRSQSPAAGPWPLLPWPAWRLPSFCPARPRPGSSRWAHW